MIQIVEDRESLSVPKTRCGTRGYRSVADRERAIRQLARTGLNHFVCYRDVRAEFSLAYGVATWAGSTPYVSS